MCACSRIQYLATVLHHTTKGDNISNHVINEDDLHVLKYFYFIISRVDWPIYEHKGVQVFGSNFYRAQKKNALVCVNSFNTNMDLIVLWRASKPNSADHFIYDSLTCDRCVNTATRNSLVFNAVIYDIFDMNVNSDVFFVVSFHRDKIRPNQSIARFLAFISYAFGMIEFLYTYIYEFDDYLRHPKWAILINVLCSHFVELLV